MKILFVTGRSQYDSTAVFMEEMARQMSALGHRVDSLDGRQAELMPEAYKQQRAYVQQQSYDVIFTINGMLLEEDFRLGQSLLQDSGAVYCTYLMDHPLIHYERLKNPYPKIFVLSPDRNHVMYTDRYLKNIWGTAFLPHAGCAGVKSSLAVKIPYEEREIEISFFGSFIQPEKVRNQIADYPAEMQQLLESTMNLLVQNSELTLEQAVMAVFQQYRIPLPADKLPAVMAEFRIVDRYIRSYYRKRVICTLLEAGFCVDVYGDGWEKFPYPENGTLRIHAAVSFQESLEITSRSKISLNVMPWFKDGSHDRVFTAMLCGAVCLTDGSVYLKEQLQEPQNVYFYSLKGLKYLPAKVRRILAHPEQSAQVASCGKKLAEERHTWARRAEEVLDYLEQLLDMEESLQVPETVSKNVTFLQSISKTVEYFRQQEYLYALRGTTGIITQFQQLIPEYLAEKDIINKNGIILEENAVLALLQELLEAQQKQDYIWLADLLELRLLPFIISIQENYAGTIEAPALPWEGYRLELTSSGEYTLAVEGKEGWKYLHSNGKPYEEARHLAKSWFDGEHFDYVVYGLGLGYHIAALLQIDTAIRVKVLEADANIIYLAENYGGVRAWKDSGRLEIIEDPNFTELVRITNNLDGECFVIHYPSMALVRNIHYRNELEHYFIEYSSAQTQITRLMGNFVRNQKYFGREVTELREQFEERTAYIIAAGPSLDKNMEELKQLSEKKIMVSTGTVLKKLLKEGIRPDYVIVTDAGAATYVQTRDLEETGVPLLYLPTVYERVLAEYPGETYLVCQAGFKKSEQYAWEQGYPLYETGGSVTTTALDICIRLGCRRIVFVGLDLAYTGNRNHAADTAYSRAVSQGELFVTDIYGEQVATGKNLDIYRRWIEKRISREDTAGIEFIDATEGGAKIEGTRIMKLKDV